MVWMGDNGTKYRVFQILVPTGFPKLGEDEVP
jgi:hypothetical protein